MHPGCPTRRRILEDPGIGQLSPEIKAAQKAEDLAERRAHFTPDPFGDVELGPVVEQERGPLSAATGWREQKNAVRLHTGDWSKSFAALTERSAGPSVALELDRGIFHGQKQIARAARGRAIDLA